VTADQPYEVTARSNSLSRMLVNTLEGTDFT